MADRITPGPQRADGWDAVRGVDRTGAAGEARNPDALGEPVVMPDRPAGDAAKGDPDRLGHGHRPGLVANQTISPDEVVRDHPGYPVTRTASRVATGAVGGGLGAVLLAAIAYGLWLGNATDVPTFVAAAQAWVGGQSPATHHLLGLIGFVLAGVAWGALYGALVRRPTVLNGMAFGLLPTLFLWVVMAPLMGRPMFMGFTTAGLLMPLVFNVLIWGGVVGRFCERRLRPPSTAAARPTGDAG